MIEALHPGSPQMPRWNVAELADAPTFTWRNWTAMIGPGLLMGGMAIGGGEWLMGPKITARFGGGLLWLAGVSILFQALYNTEICRYTLYSGEPMFTGKFRMFPGPKFWLCFYGLLEFGGHFFPWLALFAATPLFALVTGRIPNPETGEVTLQVLSFTTTITEEMALKLLAVTIFLVSASTLFFGGKVYNAVKIVMTFKIVFVLGFVLVVAVLYSQPATWNEILSGFVKFGTVPVQRGEDLNGNRRLDPGEDWDRDGRLDGVEADRNGNNRLDPEEDLDGDGIRDGANVDNVFVALLQGRSIPDFDWTVVPFLCFMIYAAGGGGLGNLTISNYTRDQGWGMGSHVGAIPSIVMGRDLKLSHVGTVFQVTPEVLPRWRRWYNHVRRDQLAIWLPACLFGMALPSILSVEFLPRGFEVADQWLTSVMTAEAIRDQVGQVWGPFFGFMTLFCGFLVLGVSVGPAADLSLRRWTDLVWTASKRMRKLDPTSIRYVYFALLCVWMVVNLTMLFVGAPETLMVGAGMLANFGLGISCFHSLAVNHVLLPRELRPGWFATVGLVTAGLFFLSVAAITTMIKLKELGVF